jgi:hypothetical protein
MRSAPSYAAVFALGLAMQLASPSSAQTPQAAHDEAQRSLATLQSLATTQTYKGLGFESLQETKSASLGQPLRVFMVGLDALRDYQPQTDPNKMLMDVHQLIYPVVVGGQQRSSVTLREVEGKWQVASFGKPTLTKALVQMRQRQIESARVPAESLFAVNIPALNLSFLGRRSDGTLLLTPLVSDAALKLEEGQPQDAKAVFEALAPRARELKTGPYIAD